MWKNTSSKNHHGIIAHPGGEITDNIALKNMYIFLLCYAWDGMKLIQVILAQQKSYQEQQKTPANFGF